MITMSIRGLSSRKLMSVADQYETRLRAHIMSAMKDEMAPLHTAVIAAMALMPRNAPLTLLLKKSETPLEDTGSLARVGNYKVWPMSKEQGGIGVFYGVPDSVRGPKQSKFRGMADLVLWLNGSRNLRKPLYRIMKVTEKMAKLFAILSGATRRGRRRSRKEARAALTGRARVLFDKARGREIPPLKVGTTLIVRPRPFLRDAVLSRRAQLEAMLTRAHDDTVTEMLMEAMD